MAETTLSATAGDRPVRSTALSFAVTAALFLLLCTTCELRWETNDDPGMAMAAHGFGLAAFGTPNLIYSNVLWGYVVRAIPDVGGVLGYSLATLAALFLACWTICRGLLRLGAGIPAAILATVLVGAPAIVFPQFTIGAGLLTVAAVIAALVYARSGGTSNLVAAVLLGVCGFLVRFEECLLVLVVALPLLPWRLALRDRRLQAALACAAVAMLAATTFDHWSYGGADWRAFQSLEPLRAQFTDFNVGDRLLQEHPDVVALHGYSRNDIDLVGNYFFADPAIANPAALAAMVGVLGPSAVAAGGIGAGLDAVAALWHPRLLPLLCCALALLALRPRWSIAAAWLVFVLAMFAVGASGRPGVDVLRIYVPVLALLVLAPLAWQPTRPARSPRAGFPRWFAGIPLLIVVAWTGWVLVPAAIRARAEVQRVQRDLAGFPNQSVVSWGNAFPYQSAFPVLARDADLRRRIRLYSLGTDTFAPYAVAVAEERAGRGMLRRLGTPGGVPLMASDAQLALLRTYCREHHLGDLVELGRIPMGATGIRTVRCRPGPAPRQAFPWPRHDRPERS